MTAQKHAVDDCSAQELYPLYTLRSEEHTSELQSHLNLVCRLLLEKKNIFDLYLPGAVASRHFGQIRFQRDRYTFGRIYAAPVQPASAGAPTGALGVVTPLLSSSLS